MRCLFSLMLAMIFAISCSTASAAVVGDIPSGQVQFEDDDFEALVNAGGTIAAPGANTTLDVGDFLVGMLRITALYSPWGVGPVAGYTPTDPSFTVVFALKVTSTTAVNLGGRPIQLTAASDAEWGTLGLKALGFDPVFDGTGAIIYDDPNNISFGATTSASLSTVGGTPLWELGFNGDPDLFWGASGPSDISGLPALPEGTSVGLFNAALNVTHTYAAGANVLFLNQAVADLFFSGGAADGDDRAQIRIEGSLLSPTAASVAGGFDINSDADVFAVTNVVPEPGSMLIWTGMALAGAVAARRRRKISA